MSNFNKAVLFCGILSFFLLIVSGFILSLILAYRLIYDGAIFWFVFSYGIAIHFKTIFNFLYEELKPNHDQL